MRDIMGPLIELPAYAGESNYTVIRSILPPETIIPPHSHPDGRPSCAVHSVLAINNAPGMVNL